MAERLSAKGASNLPDKVQVGQGLGVVVKKDPGVARPAQVAGQAKIEGNGVGWRVSPKNAGFPPAWWRSIDVR